MAHYHRTEENRARKAVRLAVRSFKGDNCSKGKGKRRAAKCRRRLDRALCREVTR